MKKFISNLGLVDDKYYVQIMLNALEFILKTIFKVYLIHYIVINTVQYSNVINNY